MNTMMEMGLNVVSTMMTTLKGKVKKKKKKLNKQKNYDDYDDQIR